MALKPLIVITGNIRVDGGDTHVVRQQEGEDAQNGVQQMSLVHTRKVTKDRRAANVVSTEYMRRVRAMCVIKTPYGSLVEAEKLLVVKELIADATRAVATFNARVGEAATSQLTNALLWEHLRGNRLAAVEGWLARGVAMRIDKVRDAAQTLSVASP